MDLSEFNTNIEQFSGFLLDNLSSDRPLEITNTYVKQFCGGKYLFLSVNISSEPSGTYVDNIAGQNVEMTILYDRFYSVPVLYFRIDGKVDFSNKYTAVDIHPVLQSPYLHVHACETQFMMMPSGLGGVEYLKLWFALQLTMALPQLQLRKQKKKGLKQIKKEFEKKNKDWF